MRWLMSKKKKRKGHHWSSRQQKRQQIIKWPKRKTEIVCDKWNDSTYHILTFYLCANLTASWEKRLLSIWWMHQTWHTTNTLHIPSSQLLSWWDDAGDNCIVSLHVVCSLRHNQLPSAISHSPDIQEDPVARSNHRRMVGWSCCGDALTCLAFPDWNVYIFIVLTLVDSLVH